MAKSDWGEHSDFAVRLRCLVHREKKKKKAFAKLEAGVEEREYLQVRLRAADSQTTYENSDFSPEMQNNVVEVSKPE